MQIIFFFKFDDKTFLSSLVTANLSFECNGSERKIFILFVLLIIWFLNEVKLFIHTITSYKSNFVKNL